MFWAAFISFFLSMLTSVVLDKLLFFLEGFPGNILIIIAIFLFYFFLFTRPIVRNLRLLADGLMSMASGNLDYRVSITNKDELGQVAQSINFMAEQLQEKIDKERQVEHSKLELITSVSHDLRTPLTSIIGYLNLLKNDDYTDLKEHKRYIVNAYNKSQQLKNLIDDLFEYTRLTSGTANLSLTIIDLNGLLRQIINEFEPIAQENSLTVRTILNQTAIYGYVDSEKMVRSIDNLLMNAIKFSLKPGEITVKLFEEQHKIYLTFENRGKPISKEQESLLFERFYKADPSRNETHITPGVGMGLSIAKNIIELHGGRIGLNHQNGLFTFFIELPRVVD